MDANLLLKQQPLLCCLMSHTDPLEIVDRVYEASSMGADLIDLRIDVNQVINSWKHPDVLLLNMVECSELPVVISCKIIGPPDQEVLDTVKKIFSVKPAYIEIPYFAAETLLDDISLKKENSTKIIVSKFLNNLGTIEEIRNEVKMVANTGADVVKITSIASSLDDSLKILQLYPFARSLNIKLISFAYGRLGFISQIMAPFYGAEFTYAAIKGGDALMRVDDVRKMLDGFSTLLYQTEHFNEDFSRI